MALAGGGFLREVLALGMTGVVVRVALEAGAAGVVFEEEVERVVKEGFISFRVQNLGFRVRKLIIQE